MLSLFSVIREISCYEERGGMQRKANSAATTVVCYNYVYTFMYELSRKQFVFFFVFSVYGRVLCTNKRLYVRLSRTCSRKT